MKIDRANSFNRNCYVRKYIINKNTKIEIGIISMGTC